VNATKTGAVRRPGRRWRAKAVPNWSRSAEVPRRRLDEIEVSATDPNLGSRPRDGHRARRPPPRVRPLLPGKTFRALCRAPDSVSQPSSSISPGFARLRIHVCYRARGRHRRTARLSRHQRYRARPGEFAPSLAAWRLVRVEGPQSASASSCVLSGPRRGPTRSTSGDVRENAGAGSCCARRRAR